MANDTQQPEHCYKFCVILEETVLGSDVPANEVAALLNRHATETWLNFEVIHKPTGHCFYGSIRKQPDKANAECLFKVQ